MQGRMVGNNNNPTKKVDERSATQKKFDYISIMCYFFS
jgi:hypothetical protein